MTEPLEPIVRPFQLPAFTPPQRYVTPGQQSHPPVVFFIQLTGQAPQARMGQYTNTTTSYCTKFVVEKDINPNDAPFNPNAQ